MPVPVRFGVTLVAALLFALTMVASSHAAARDSDHDGMPNRWERAQGLDPHRADARGNPDRDGLVNVREFRNHTNPLVEDSDHDGIDDGDEVDEFETNPNDSDDDNDGVRDGDENADHDGTRNEDEDDSSESCRADDDDRDHDGVANEDENEQHSRTRDRDSNDNGTPDGDEDVDEDGVNNEDEDDNADDACDGDTDDDGVDDEDRNDAIGAVLSYDEVTGVLVIETDDGNLTGLVTDETRVKWSDCDCGEEGDQPWFALVVGAPVAHVVLEDGVFYKVYLLCDEQVADGEEEPGDGGDDGPADPPVED